MNQFALIRKPVTEENLFGLPVDWRLSPAIVHIGSELECREAIPIGTYYLSNNEQGVSWVIGEIVETDVEASDFWDVADRLADIEGTASRLFGMLSAEQQDAHGHNPMDWAENGYHPMVDVPAGVCCSALSDAGMIWAKVEGSDPSGIQDAIVKVKGN